MTMKPSLVTAPRNEFEGYNAIEFDHNSQSKGKELNLGGFLFKYILSFLAASCSEFGMTLTFQIKSQCDYYESRLIAFQDIKSCVHLNRLFISKHLIYQNEKGVN